ncbi:MAG: ABC transporter ATP-binding protein [Halanaerobiaceae bacterium]
MIEVKDLHKIYQNGQVEVEALKDISFSVNGGEFTAIMGPSGSGKSTLMNLIGCLDKPTSGTYLLEGEDVGSYNDNQLAEIRNRKVGFVFQQFNLLPRTNVLKNVEVPLIYRGLGRRKRQEIAREVLEKVGLGHRLKHRPNEISGGQKQRVAIARALVNNPSLLLADEPTGNLDTGTGSEIMDVFHDLHDMGHTVLMVTHEPMIAEAANRIISLRDGKIVSDEVIA